jgi:hypothetical protein
LRITVIDRMSEANGLPAKEHHTEAIPMWQWMSR